MLRHVSRRVASGLGPAPNSSALGQVRYASNLKAIKNRINSTKNFSKITKSMKMVAAAKMRKLESPTVESRPFAAASQPVFEDLPAVAEEEEQSKDAKKHLLVILSSDRGLCGAVNANTVKKMRPVMEGLVRDGQQVTVNLVGEKARPPLARDSAALFNVQLTEVGRSGAPTFAEACVVADEVARVDADEIHLFFNKYQSAISYETTHAKLPTVERAASVNIEDKYEFDNESQDEILRNAAEFYLASQFYNALLENATTEMAQRMSAMDSASRNANDMIERLTVQYNRGRQASITTELIEIISGAESLKG